MPLPATSTAIMTRSWATRASSWSESFAAPLRSANYAPSCRSNLNRVLGMVCGLGCGVIGWARSANSLRKSPCELACHFYDPRIRADTIEHGQQPFGLRKRPLSQIVFELMKRIIHAQPVVFQSLLQQREVALLLEEAFKDERELLRGAVQRVVITGFVYFSALFIAQSLLAEVGNSPVNIEVDTGKIVQLAGQLENPGSYCVA